MTYSLRTVIVGLALAATPVAVATQLTWGGYETNGVGLADGSQVPVGSLVRVGTFTADTDISGHATDLSYLNSHFIEFASAHVGDGNVNGDGQSHAAHWLANSSKSSSGIAGGRIYYWVFDSTTPDAAKQIGIFTAPGNSRWLFPDDADVPNTAITDISDVPHDGTGCLAGSYGVGKSMLSGNALYNLAQLPTPTPSPSPSPSTTPTPSPSPSLTATPSPSATPAGSVTPTPTPSPTPAITAQLLNLSTREEVGIDDNVLIGGFIIAGTDSKKVLLRGLGPSLTVNGSAVSGALGDPTLELHNQQSLIAANDNWRDDQPAEIAGTGIPPTNDSESAIVGTLAALPASGGGAAYTAVLAGKNQTTGIGLLEIYDLNAGSNAELANISTRGLVGAEPGLLIGGFIPGPSERAPIKVLIRALGPSLAAQGVTGALQDPVLELRDSNGVLVATNDDWKQAPNVDDIAATLAPADERESAILISLPPAASGYTAIVRGANNTIGVALVEIYALP